ncbi:SDR family NAD(P)-dependent oxidoreductase [Rhizobium sp. NRK18]|uniref:SDR family NAD(P)-dependent oxidoreductase n=1 Tax=Rhizobium sp. NRK18 TaxID=2964667 RepID=UPI0021C4C530|nr:glucose 1-dehydrogenase [Rhizobium sp. NRK18]MCQ2005083.1 glucose 1-dehydrogenase [Rhizobium sp. NRK18]
MALRQRMAGRVCLVTGGGSGIGLATALQLASEGADAVVIAGRRPEEGEAAAEACRQRGARSAFIRTDVTVEDDIRGLVEATLDRFSVLDVVFNNAAFQEKRAPLEEQDSQTYAQVFDTNVRSVFLCLKYQLPVMAGRPGASVVINASVSGIRNPNPGFALYAASKAAVISMTRSAAMEWAPKGVRINGFAPGRVLTEMMRGSGVDLDTVAANLPLRRMGTPEEAAEAVVWLSSDEASYVVGHILAADGGFLSA